MVGEADCEEVQCDFLYNDGSNWHFMNKESYEQFEVAADSVGESRYFLIDNSSCSVLMHNNKPIQIYPPNFVVMRLTDCDPAVQGNTAIGATKVVTTETGYKVAVPLFITITDKLKIDTRDGGRFIERAGK